MNKDEKVPLFLNHSKCNPQQTESNSKVMVKSLLLPDAFPYQKDVAFKRKTLHFIFMFINHTRIVFYCFLNMTLLSSLGFPFQASPQGFKNAFSRERFPHPYKECFVLLPNRCSTVFLKLMQRRDRWCYKQTAHAGNGENVKSEPQPILQSHKERLKERERENFQSFK